jgi:hypothetical protein
MRSGLPEADLRRLDQLDAQGAGGWLKAEACWENPWLAGDRQGTGEIARGEYEKEARQIAAKWKECRSTSSLGR